MTLTNVAYFSPVAGGLSIDVTLNSNSGNDRKVSAIGLQRRGTGVNLGSPTLNGVPPTGEIISQDSTNARARAIGHYWDDVDLPASAGTYSLAYTGGAVNTGVGAMYAENAKQGAPADAQSSVPEASGTSSSFSVTADTGSVYFIGTAADLVGITFTTGGDQSILIDETLADKTQAEYKTLDGNVDHSWSASAVYASIAFAIEPAASSPTVTVTEDSAAFGDTINFSTANLGTLTSWTISDGTNTINLTSGSDTQATIPALGDEVNRVVTGTNLTVTVGDGVGTAQDTINLNPPAGYTSVKLTSGFDTSEDSYLFSYGGTPAIGDEFLFVTADVTLDSLGGIEADGDITTTVYGTDATDGFMESFVLTLGPAVGGGSRGTFLSSDSNTIGGNFIIWN